MENLEKEPLLAENSTQINYINSSGQFGASTSGNYGNYGASVSYSQEFTTPPGVHPKTKSYWYRWYILGLFSLVGALENIAWNTWGPIEASARYKFDWTKGTVSLLADWGAITFVLCVFPSAWLLDVKGRDCE